MNYYKIIDSGYILAIGTGTGGVEITEAEYDEIMAVIKSKTFEESREYFLREDLTWEECAPEPPDPDEEIDGADVMDILLGGAE